MWLPVRDFESFTECLIQSLVAAVLLHAEHVFILIM
jgi:hypothetical protein